MAKVKGAKVLNKAITRELADFGIKKAVCTDEYSYLFDKKMVTYKLTENTVEDKWFSEFIESRFGYEVRYPFIISLLHEVGHHKANDNIVGDIYDFCMAEKERISEEMINADDEEQKALEWEYFNLPDEIMATAWAVDYAKKHPKKVKKMWKNAVKALMNFYEKNNVLDDID